MVYRKESKYKRIPKHAYMLQKNISFPPSNQIFIPTIQAVLKNKPDYFAIQFRLNRQAVEPELIE